MRQVFFVLVIFLILSGISVSCFAQTPPPPPPPIPIQIQIPDFDWQGIVSSFLSQAHPAVIVAMGFGLSVWCLAFIVKMFKALAFFTGYGVPTAAEVRERGYADRYESDSGYQEYRDRRDAEKKRIRAMKDHFNAVNAEKDRQAYKDKLDEYHNPNRPDHHYVFYTEYDERFDSYSDD